MAEHRKSCNVSNYVSVRRNRSSAAPSNAEPPRCPQGIGWWFFVPTMSNNRIGQAEKLEPHPQELVALGLLKTNPRPMISSLKSIVVPLR